MPTEVRILFEPELDKGKLTKLIRDHVIGTKPVLDFSVEHVNSDGSTLKISKKDAQKLSIDLLPLTNRTIRVLSTAHMHNSHCVVERREDKDIHTIGELANKTSRDLLRYFEFGPVALQEVRQALKTIGMHLQGEQSSLLE